MWFPLVIPVVAIVSVFTFVSIASWSDNRRKEREAFHRHETYRRILEQPGTSAEAVQALMREEETYRQRRRLEGLKLGGMVTAAAGVGATIFLYVLDPEDSPIWVAGLVPFLIGIVLTLYAFVIAPKPPDPGT